MKIKVCGMGAVENIEAVAALQPDYLGFIFFEKSARNFVGTLPVIPPEIIKTGVFVDASLEFIQQKINELGLKAVQLHGNETPEFCSSVKKLDVEVFKVFSIKENFEFSALNPFENRVDYFLFDTKGALPGGNGYTFDWEVLKQYKSKTPFILSGGIGLDEIEKVKEILKTNLPIYALDINSKFEIEPALKDVVQLKEFFKEFK
ncbi:phosphoribosylanthranilate isomerase [Bacteroidota bacterium]